MNNQEIFFALINKEQVGPLTEAALADLFEKGTITTQTYVWSKGWPAWKRLAELLTPPPPPEEPTAQTQKTEPKPGPMAGPFAGPKTERAATEPGQTAGPFAERVIWSGRRSQWTAAGSYATIAGLWLILGGPGLIAGIVAKSGLITGLGAAVTVVAGLAAWLVSAVVKTEQYTLTNQRIKTSSGLLNKNHQEIELYRVRDTAVREPLGLRLTGKGLGNIIVYSSDSTSSVLQLRGIPNAAQIREELRSAIEACRRRKGVRVTEF